MSETFTFSIGADGIISVRSYDELLKWIEKERAQWSWMAPGDGRTDRYGLSNELQQTWNSVFNNVRQSAAQGYPLENARDFLVPISSGLILVSTTGDGALVLDIRRSAGDLAAMAAFGFIKQRLNMQNTPFLREEFLGVLLSVLPDLRDSADWADRLKRERTNFRMATRSLIEKVDAEASDRDKNARETARRIGGVAKRIFDMRRHAWRMTQAEWKSLAEESVSEIAQRANLSLSSIASTENSYREFMRLKAPVEYWEKKANEHRVREAKARKLLYFYFPITFVLLSAIFVYSGSVLLSHPDTVQSKSPIALYVVVSGGLILISTLAFWIGRLLTKLYLSEHHLRNDAEERATMTTTYLALTAENAAGEADRQIILNALFRATPDGIVKEDGPGDIGLQGLLAKMLAR